MTARIFAFRGTEADSDQTLVQHAYAACPEPSDDRDLMETTRCYPRTLHGARAAFPRDPEFADPFAMSFAMQDAQVRSLWRKWLGRIGCFAVFTGIGAMLAWRG